MQSGLAGALQQGSVSAAAMDTPATHHIDDLVLLEGPHSRRRELWLVLRAVRDFIAGFRALHFMGPCVTVFGSARFSAGEPAYQRAREVGGAIARLGFTVMTGEDRA